MYGIEFRPLDFDSVLGLEDIKEILKNIIKSGEYDPGYLFVGPFSSGKTTIARIFIRSVFCLNRKEDMSPCNKCSSCKQFLEGRHPGYTEIDATNCGKDDIRDIKESLQYESISHKKVILFDEAHGISKEGKDALLKQLEIDDKNVILLFGTTEVEKMPNQLRSRLIEFQLPEPSESDVLKKLESICKIKKLNYDRDALYTIIQATGRHYRDAENRLRQISLLGDISEENVKKAVTLYIDEIASLLLTLPNDLSKAVKFADYISSYMSVSSIYENILRILNDTIKYMNGISFDSKHYTKILQEMKKLYGYDVFEIIDYIVSKNKLTNLTFFVSDLLVLHYRFRRGSFKNKNFIVPEKEKMEEDSPKKNRAPDSLKDVGNLPPYKREDAVREFKMKQRQQKMDERVPEKVSELWGPEKVNKVPSKIHRKEISKGEFRKIVGGNLDEEKI